MSAAAARQRDVMTALRGVASDLVDAGDRLVRVPETEGPKILGQRQASLGVIESGLGAPQHRVDPRNLPLTAGQVLRNEVSETV
jgi:hypothetical protein